jgi:hypothetical protein
MSAPRRYFQEAWVPFRYQEQTYALDHLDEYVFTAIDSEKIRRNIIVSFSDHCFTRRPEVGDDPALVYPQSDRRPGHFCFERYELSLDLKGYIDRATTGKVYLSEAENLAIINTTTSSGLPVYYGIFFNLDRAARNIPAHLHMRIRTAFPFTTNQPVTHGDIRFSHLMTLRMRREFPKRFIGGSRRWPDLG